MGSVAVASGPKKSKPHRSNDVKPRLSASTQSTHFYQTATTDKRDGESERQEDCGDQTTGRGGRAILECHCGISAKCWEIYERGRQNSRGRKERGRWPCSTGPAGGGGETARLGEKRRSLRPRSLNSTLGRSTRAEPSRPQAPLSF